MKLKGRRQSNNIQVAKEVEITRKDGTKAKTIASTKDPHEETMKEIDKILPGKLARHQLKHLSDYKRGRAMGVGPQLDAIDKAGKEAKGPYQPDRNPEWFNRDEKFFKHTQKDIK